MRKIILLIASALCLVACKDSGRTLTSATGTIYECLVVSNTHAYDLVKETMEADMPCLPQMESYFKLMHVTPALFDNYLKPTRNILYVDINADKYTTVKAKTSTNRWSKPQVYYHIQSPTYEDFAAYWQQHGDEVREYFVREEIRRQTTFYRASTNKKARAALNRRNGADLWIPEDYMLIMDTILTIPQPAGQLNSAALNSEALNSNALNSEALNGDQVALVWCCNNKGPMRRDVVVYSYPYTDPNTFTMDYLNQRRDQVLGSVITATVPGSHMGTEYKIFPPQMRYIQGLNPTEGEFYAAEIRGLWKIYDGEAMGGPYVSHTRLDESTGQVITAETFVYAGGQKKRNALRQAEAILYTLQLSYERNQLQEVKVK